MNTTPLLLATTTRRLAMRALAALSLAPLAARAQPSTSDRDVAPFDAIALRTVGQLVIEEGAQAPVRVEAEPALLARIVTRVVDRMLVIEAAGSFATQRPLRYRVRVGALRRLEASGGGSIEAQYLRGEQLAVALTDSATLRIGVLSARALEATLDGAAEARIGGKAASLTLAIGGSGTFDGSQLACEQARVAITGSGEARVRVRDALDADVSGAGEVIYFGAPRVRSRVTGSGSVERG